MNPKSLLDRIGSAEGYVATAVVITLLTTGLLLTRFITEATWADLTKWVWSGVVAGGAISAYRK